jgi:hypothetical protein
LGLLVLLEMAESVAERSCGASKHSAVTARQGGIEGWLHQGNCDEVHTLTVEGDARSSQLARPDSIEPTDGAKFTKYDVHGQPQYSSRQNRSTEIAHGNAACCTRLDS